MDTVDSEGISADLLPQDVENKLNMELLPGNPLQKDIQSLAGEFGFTVDSINYICMQQNPFCFFLDQWCRREGKRATLERLHNALIEIGRQDMAKLVQKTIKSVKKASFSQLQSLAKVQYKREKRREEETATLLVTEETEIQEKPPSIYIVHFPENNQNIKQVVELTNNLRKKQIDARTAVLEDQSSSMDRHYYVFSSLQKADYVLVVCSSSLKLVEQLKKKDGELNDEEKEVMFSLNFMVNDIYRRKGINAKYIPVFFSEYQGANLPQILKTPKSYTIPAEFDALVRRIYQVPDVELPQVKEKKIFQPRVLKP